MGDLYGKCGCNCGKCAAYIGNIKCEEDKEKCSKGWKKFLNIGLKADSCICLGCQATNPWQTGNAIPDRSCNIRKCAERSKVKTCANCYSFPCDFLKERSKMDYSRPWVERRVGEKISEEEYETFVKAFETFKNVSCLREALRDDEISSKHTIEPLNVKVAKFPKQLNLEEKNVDILINTYDFLVKILQCRCETYIQQVINERRKKPMLVLLWVFAVYGKTIDDDCTKLVIKSEEVGDKKEFDSIVRKKDNYFHGAAEQAVLILKEYGFNMEHTALSKKEWMLTLTVAEDEKIKEALKGLRMLAKELIEKYGEPEYITPWKYKGEAFKKFEKADFDVFMS